jgi:hypothetical protein
MDLDVSRGNPGDAELRRLTSALSGDEWRQRKHAGRSVLINPMLLAIIKA